MPEPTTVTDDDPLTTTGVLARFVSAIRYETLPDDVVQRVKRQCLDLIGVALVGSAQPAGRLASEFTLRFRSAPESTIWGRAERTSPPEAAFANGVAAHATDYDDMWLPDAHPTAPILSGAFAVAESTGASGKDLIAALAAGYEVMGRLHSAANGRAGWHPTGVFGTFGAAAACARLLGLSGSETAIVFGIASSSTSGIDAQGGTMGKPFHAGHAARGGVVAALLAASGFTATSAAFDSRRNFFTAFFRDMHVETWRITAGLGETYHIISPGIGIKMWPAGYYMHQAFEAALGIVTRFDLAPGDVDGVVVGIRAGSRFDRPQVRVGLEGKFSLQYVVALAIVERNLTVGSFGDDVAQSDAVQSMLRRIRVEVDDSIPANTDLTYNPVTITTTDGRALTAAVPMPRSHWKYPLGAAEWTGKFEQNARTMLAADAVRRLRDMVSNLEDVADISDIAAVLRDGLLPGEQAQAAAALPVTGG